MTIHKEGYRIILTTILIITAVNLLTFNLIDIAWLNYGIATLSFVMFILVLQFFRYPKRNIVIDENCIIAPADGEVVVIEEVQDQEYFSDKRTQISIFMSPTNVHVNRYPVQGKVSYVKYHPGAFMVAWNPKSSLENERNTIVVQKENGVEVLIRQIAGFVARRIVCYAKEGDAATQGADCGFIKFGSRVDVIVPSSVKINVQLNQKVKGGETILAKFE